MKSDKTDRRIKYTKMVLKQALVNLLKTKPISKITVKEICEEADINRATFYSHYTDQYDLLKQIENELTEDINQYISSYPFNDNESEYLQMMCKIFEYIKENSELCSVLLGENGDREFQKDIMQIVQKQCISEWTTKRTIKKLDAEYIYSFITIGCIGMIQKWLEDDMKKSAHDMAEILIKLINQGIYAFV
jgi:AcrR family transcriptional regulator